MEASVCRVGRTAEDRLMYGRSIKAAKRTNERESGVNTNISSHELLTDNKNMNNTSHSKTIKSLHNDYYQLLEPVTWNGVSCVNSAHCRAAQVYRP